MRHSWQWEVNDSYEVFLAVEVTKLLITQETYSLAREFRYNIRCHANFYYKIRVDIHVANCD